MRDVCHRVITLETTVGPFGPASPCPECGHSDSLHPGVLNPALTGCLVCELRNHLPAQQDES